MGVRWAKLRLYRKQITINTVMVVEIYSYESGIRCIDKKEYSSIDEWEKDLFLLKFRGIVGYRRYDEMDMEHFNKLTETQRNNIPCKAEFDKEAYINHGAPRSPYI